MTTVTTLGNDVDLEVDNISAAESDEDDREDEIKKLLAGALSNETFYDDEESEASFAQSSLFQDNHDGQNDISLHSSHSNPNLANISTNGFSFLNGYSDQTQYNDDGQEKNSRPRPSGPQTERGTEEVEAKNATVSLMHKKHCPQQIGNGDGDDESRIWIETSKANNTEQLKTLCDFRERQIARCEESISVLSKDKRALNHQVGLMRTEMIQMKGTQDDLEKALKLKNEEIIYLKSKIQEVINEYENLKQGETDLKDENSRLNSEISRLEQEVKLTSTIGSSLQQAEVNEVVRQIREKHAREIASWKSTLAEMEGQIRIQKRSEQIFQLNATGMGINVPTQTLASSFNVVTRGSQSEAAELVDSLSQTNSIQKCVRNESTQVLTEHVEVASDSEIATFYEEEQKKLINFYEREIQEYKVRLTALPAKLYSTWKENELHHNVNLKPLMLSASTMTSHDTIRTSRAVHNVSSSCDIESLGKGNGIGTTSAETQTFAKVKDASTQSIETVSKNSSHITNVTSSVSIFVQTDETLKTYEVLAGLIEQWAQEISDGVKRAELAESQAKFAEDSLKKLRKRFKDVSRMVALCRKEWKTQEQLLKKKHAETKTHYINLLLNLGQKLESLEMVENGS